MIQTITNRLKRIMDMSEKRNLVWMLVLLLFCLKAGGQTVAVKTDLVKWGTASLNIEPEVRIGSKSTLNLGLSWNPWTFKDNKKWRHLLVQPEYRYWFCKPFGGHFIGVHPMYMRFNAGNIGFTFGLANGMKDYRYQGNLWGGGIGYGYHWILNNRWSIEAEIGLGVGYVDYSQYECVTCGDKLRTDTEVRFMPTKAAVSLIYVIK